MLAGCWSARLADKVRQLRAASTLSESGGFLSSFNDKVQRYCEGWYTGAFCKS
jgi:hypothetical protein